PPPVASTKWVCSSISFCNVLDSILRNAASPSLAKISFTNLLAKRSISSSRSKNGTCRYVATFFPSVVFPEPGKPIKNILTNLKLIFGVHPNRVHHYSATFLLPCHQPKG